MITFFFFVVADAPGESSFGILDRDVGLPDLVLADIGLPDLVLPEPGLRFGEADFCRPGDFLPDGERDFAEDFLLLDDSDCLGD